MHTTIFRDVCRRPSHGTNRAELIGVENSKWQTVIPRRRRRRGVGASHHPASRQLQTGNRVAGSDKFGIFAPASASASQTPPPKNAIEDTCPPYLTPPRYSDRRRRRRVYMCHHRRQVSYRTMVATATGERNSSYRAPHCEELDPNAITIFFLCFTAFVQKITFVLRKINKNCCHQSCTYSLQYASNRLSARASPQTPLGELTALIRTP